MNLFALDSAHFEYSVVKSLDHKYILKTKGFFEDTDHLIIIYELLTTDLRTLLVELLAPLTEGKIKEFFYQMLLSVQHCHNKNILHRDIKLENFLMGTSEDEQLVVKLADFGLACKYQPDKPPS